jgi:hypothetical protein
MSNLSSDAKAFHVISAYKLNKKEEDQTSVAKSKPSICFLIKSLISLAFNCITIPLLLFI